MWSIDQLYIELGFKGFRVVPNGHTLALLVAGCAIGAIHLATIATLLRTFGTEKSGFQF